MKLRNKTALRRLNFLDETELKMLVRALGSLRIWDGRYESNPYVRVLRFRQPCVVSHYVADIRRQLRV